MLVTDLDKPAMRAVTFARASRANSLEAVTVAADDDHTKDIRQQWEALDPGIPLKIIAMPLRWILTGRKVSPGVFEVAEALGKEECRKRITHYGLL